MRAIVLGLVLCVASTSAFAQEETAAPREKLSFKDVLARVRANNESLKAARAQIQVSDGEVEQAYVGWQPKLNALGNVTFNSQEAVLDSGAFLAPLIPFLPPDAAAMLMGGEPTVIQPHVQLGAALTLQQTLFNISVLRAPGVAKAARQAAISRVDATEDELLFSAATLYTTIIGVKQLEAAAQRASSVAEERVKDARIQVEAGTATQLVLTRAETDRVVAQGQIQSLRAQQRGLLANLAAIVGATQEVDVENERLSDFVRGPTEGIEARSVIEARQRELAAAEKAIGLNNMNWLPTLAADGRLSYSNVAGFAGKNYLATATINLIFPIYDGYERYAATHIAEARALQAKHALEAERLQANAFLEDARAKVEAAKAELTQSEAQFELANQAVKQTEDLSKQGLSTNLELTDADSRRFSADRARVQKQLELDLAALRVFYAAGGDLLPGDATVAERE